MIRCPQCGADNEDYSHFCELCGEKLKSIYTFCPECSKENVENAKFCTECDVSLKTSESMINGLEVQENLKKVTDKSDEIVSLNLTPAETIMILNNGRVTSTKELLKVTFIDLIFKNVFKLEVREVEKKGIFGNKIVKKTYLEEGKNFNMPLKPHEEVFQKHLPSKADSKRFKKLQQRVYKKYRYNYAQKKLLEPLALEGYFTVEKKFLGEKYSISDKGIETEQVINQLKDEGKDLENWIEKDPQKARAYLLMGGSNIFLTDDYYFGWFKDNSKKISKLFIGAAVVGTAYAFTKVRWYSAFSRHSHDIDFDDFDDFDRFDDDFTDIFSDFDTFDTFDSIDFNDFDSGFDSGGFDGGGDFEGGGE